MRKLFYLLPIVGILLYSCGKDELIRTGSSLTQESFDVPVRNFNSFTDLNETINLLNEMGEKERRLYEKNLGYKSIYTISFEKFEELDLSKVETVSEIESFVRFNSEYMRLENLYEDEKELRVLYSDNPYSIIANSDRLFTVGDYAIKVFDNGVVCSRKEDIELLRRLDQIMVQDVPKNLNYEISFFNSVNNMNRSNCHPTNNVETSTSGDDRTRIIHGVDLLVLPGPPVSYTEVTAYGTIKPFKRTLGIWFPASRTISGHIAFLFTFNTDVPTSHSLTVNQAINSSSPSYSQTRSDMEAAPMSAIVKDLEFQIISSWGDTPGTPFVMENCN